MFLKSQISIEYMLIMGFATIMLVPLVVIYYTYSSDTSESVAASQALQISRKIIDASESVYYLGKPSQTTLKVNFPDNINLINLSNREVIFKMKTKNGIVEIVQVSAVNITGNLPTSQGIHILTIRSEGKYIQVTSN